MSVIGSYAPILFIAIGFGESASLRSAVVTGMVALSMTLLSLLIVDKLGRQTVLIIGRIQMFISQILVGSIMAIDLGDQGELSKEWYFGVDLDLLSSNGFHQGRQIIDGSLMVDEIISWARKQKIRLMLCKVDFEKAFDSLSWNFLLSIMEQMRFSSKWRNWILSCLNSSFPSVLINGSPTMEFKLEIGLRQGDHVSPFLFIIAVEALNIAILEATNREWSLSNTKNLSRILTCFHLAFGLKVNFNKSKLLGIGVSNLKVNSFASSIGYLASHLPGSYLGLPIGAKMSRCANWKPLVERF
nr:putative RNA-directed DNA polymerase, eukaryota, reverse transcriptase zinc-binding domain protein [Tanacetum cinerariifolium]